jgi:hypothetical protein
MGDKRQGTILESERLKRRHVNTPENPLGTAIPAKTSPAGAFLGLPQSSSSTSIETFSSERRGHLGSSSQTAYDHVTDQSFYSRLPRRQGDEALSYRPTHLGHSEIERGVQRGLAPSNRQFGQSENEHRGLAPSHWQFGQSENEHRGLAPSHWQFGQSENEHRGLAPSHRQFGQSENERGVQPLSNYERSAPRPPQFSVLRQPVRATSLGLGLGTSDTHTSPRMGRGARSATPASYSTAQAKNESSQGSDSALRVLPFTVPNPSTELDGDWVETANMPERLVEALQAKFEATLCDAAKKRRWSSYRQSEEDCIMTHAIGRGKNHSVFKDGRSRPCDLCKKSKRLCAGLVEHEGVLKIGLRLPDARFRGTDNWEQAEHYVYTIT